MKKLPYPNHLDVTPIVVTITSGIDANGVPAVVSTFNGKCRFSESVSKRITEGSTGLGPFLELSALAYMGTDIAPEVKTVTGSVVVNEVEYKIHHCGRPYNPDGTVNHTKLELI